MSARKNIAKIDKNDNDKNDNDKGGRIARPDHVKRSAETGPPSVRVKTAREAGQRDEGACAQAGVQIELPGWYVVRRGDSLWTIARQHYRSGRAYRLIYRANRKRIRGRKRLKPCQRLRLPLPEPAG